MKEIECKCEHYVICPRCGKEFVVFVTNSAFKKGVYKKFCSRKCANFRILTSEIKQKIKDSVNDYYNKRIKINKVIEKPKKKFSEEERAEISKKQSEVRKKYWAKIHQKDNRTDEQKYRDLGIDVKRCVVCGTIIPYKSRHKRITCSDECAKKMRVDAGKTYGRVSASVRVKRSKNEIEFANLCISTFKDCEITTNEPFFNGWDADVILKDYKVAVLWNGVWHYKQVRKNQSLAQIQSRDAIKLKSINEAGFTPYIIKDMGPYSSDKVMQEFEAFKKFLIEEKQIKI